MADSTSTPQPDTGLLEKRRIQDWLCRKEFPSASDYFAEIGTVTLSFTVIACFCATLCVMLYFLQAFNIEERVRSEYRQALLERLASVFPVRPLGCRFLARSLISFMSLVRDLFDGRRKMSSKLRESGIRLNLAISPCCCLKPCLKPIKPTSDNIRLLEFLINQAAWLQSLLAFIVFVGFANGTDVARFSTATDVIRIVSTVVATLTCFVLADCTEKQQYAADKKSDFCIEVNNFVEVIQERYRLKAILGFVKLILLIINLQTAILGLLADFNVIPQTSVLTARGTAALWNDIALCIEMLLLSLLATWMLHPSKCGLFDVKPDDRSKHESSYGSLEAQTHGDNENDALIREPMQENHDKIELDRVDSD